MRATPSVGLALAARAKQLNPNHPGWYWYADFYDAYRRGDDRGALGFARKSNLPGHWGMHAALAAASASGDRVAAGGAVQVLLKRRPDFAATARRDSEKWWDAEYVERLMDGWRKAGVDLPAPQGTDPAPQAAGVVAVAVLPFTDMSAAKDQEYLCEGMAEEIMNALVRVAGIRVASRTSAFRARRERAATAGDRSGALRRPRPRRQCADRGRPAASHRPVDRRRQRIPGLVGALRPEGRRRLCRPG